jgi:hypothetical protein
VSDLKEELYPDAIGRARAIVSSAFVNALIISPTALSSTITDDVPPDQRMDVLLRSSTL